MTTDRRRTSISFQPAIAVHGGAGNIIRSEIDSEREAGYRAGLAAALVTGDSVGQVASQTLENIARIGEVAELPVLRPLIGMDKLEITAEARAIGTYEISIEPDADCCSLFVPKHPGTRVSREEVAAMESRLDVGRLVATAVASAVEETFDFPRGQGPFPRREPRIEPGEHEAGAAAGGRAEMPGRPIEVEQAPPFP